MESGSIQINMLPSEGKQIIDYAIKAKRAAADQKANFDKGA